MRLRGAQVRIENWSLKLQSFQKFEITNFDVCLQTIVGQRRHSLFRIASIWWGKTTERVSTVQTVHVQKMGNSARK